MRVLKVHGGGSKLRYLSPKAMGNVEDHVGILRPWSCSLRMYAKHVYANHYLLIYLHGTHP